MTFNWLRDLRKQLWWTIIYLGACALREQHNYVIGFSDNSLLTLFVFLPQVPLPIVCMMEKEALSILEKTERSKAFTITSHQTWFNQTSSPSTDNKSLLACFLFAESVFCLLYFNLYNYHWVYHRYEHQARCHRQPLAQQVLCSAYLVHDFISHLSRKMLVCLNLHDNPLVTNKC